MTGRARCPDAHFALLRSGGTTSQTCGLVQHTGTVDLALERASSEEAAPLMEPIVLPLQPGRGWAAAPPVQRLLSLFIPTLLAVWLVSGLLLGEPANDQSPPVLVASGVASLLYVVLGPPSAYAAARILRPYPGGIGWERRVRHSLAAVAAYGLAVVAWVFMPYITVHFAFNALGTGWLYLLAAAVLGPLTLVWGLIAAMLRLVKR